MEEEILKLIEKHEKYRRRGINLIASENVLSREALKALHCDLAGRYGSNWYGGSRYAEEIKEKVEELAKKLFNAKYAFITPLSGNICDLAVIFSFTKPFDEIAGIAKEDGGYPLGYEKFDRRFYPLPVKDYVINAEELEKIKKDFPLVLIASSIILFPHPLEAIAKKFRHNIVYDASHVLGLIAGKEFQNPLKYCQAMIGSTHKSFPGPQGGIILTNDSWVAEKLSKYLLFDYDKGIGLVDNPHLNRIASLGIVMEEMLKNGREYAKQTIKNAKYLAKCLDELGVPIKFAEKGYTESHQILLNLGEETFNFFKKLEENHIFIDCIGRIGTAEVTHIGVGEKEMEEIAHMIADVYKGKNVKDKAIKIAKEFYEKFYE